MSVNYLDGLRALALKAVVEPDEHALMRRIRRWFSREFSTALKDVEDLEDEYVLQHFFESTFEEMERPQLEEAWEALVETEGERTARLAAEEEARSSEDAFYKAAVEEAEKEKKKHTPKADPPPAVQTPDLPDISMTFDHDLNLVESFGDLDPLSVPPPGKK